MHVLKHADLQENDAAVLSKLNGQGRWRKLDTHDKRCQLVQAVVSGLLAQFLESAHDNFNIEKNNVLTLTSKGAPSCMHDHNCQFVQLPS
jgi:hypothetical protein